MRVKKVAFQFLKYCFVGGIAFLADALIVKLFHERFLLNIPYSLYVSVVIGFIVGTVVNYALSKTLVFRVKSKDLGVVKKATGFVVFTIIGIIGLIITEIGMYLGTDVLEFHYLIVKCFMAGLVLIWNFVVRRIFVFREG